jgi:hypothetical protein
MKCMVQGCVSEIDELKEFSVTYGPKGPAYDEAGQRAHSAALESWTFVLIEARVSTGDRELATGHICPGHKGDSFGLAAKKGA